MKAFLHAAIIATATSIVAVPALAGIGVSVNFGDVAIGYRDGYYDSHHHWHKWHHADDYKSYRDAHPDHYRDYGHRDPGHEHDH